MKNKHVILLFLAFGLIALEQCKKDPPIIPASSNTDTVPTTFAATPYTLIIPIGFPTKTNIPTDNPLTVEGVALGKKLFHEPLLSGNNTQSCASCHNQTFSFSDNQTFSKGIDGALGTRNAQPIINSLWMSSLFWDGRALTLEDQALEPVPNPIEMHQSWSNAIAKLQAEASYPTLFKKSFGTTTITKELVVKAIAQFERTFISANSKYDRWLNGKAQLDSSELRGYNLFFTEKADCFHCHGNILFTDNLFHNNGLDAFPSDQGRQKVTNDANDEGKFKTPTLRNLLFTAPYMHNGRFTTLEQVVEFYSTGLKFSATVDPLMKNVNRGGIQLTSQEKLDLVAFLKTLTDSSFVNNTAFIP
jgi:cytochrome c peroxidase